MTVVKRDTALSTCTMQMHTHTHTCPHVQTQHTDILPAVAPQLKCPDHKDRKRREISVAGDRKMDLGWWWKKSKLETITGTDQEGSIEWRVFSARHEYLLNSQQLNVIRRQKCIYYITRVGKWQGTVLLLKPFAFCHLFYKITLDLAWHILQRLPVFYCCGHINQAYKKFLWYMKPLNGNISIWVINISKKTIKLLITTVNMMWSSK